VAEFAKIISGVVFAGKPVTFPASEALWIEKLLDLSGLSFGSSGRIRTYDQSVNSRALYH
jgi:hypothetical protein